MENLLNLLNLLQIQTALLIGPNCTGVMACAELLWLRQRWGKMKKMFPQVLMMRTMMEWMTRKETTIKKTTKPTILPQKEALLQERKGKFCPFDSCVLKLNDILPYFVALCCSEVLVIRCCYEVLRMLYQLEFLLMMNWCFQRCQLRHPTMCLGQCSTVLVLVLLLGGNTSNLFFSILPL